MLIVIFALEFANRIRALDTTVVVVTLSTKTDSSYHNEEQFQTGLSLRLSFQQLQP